MYSLTPNEVGGGGIVPLPAPAPTQTGRRIDNHNKKAAVIAGAVTGTCIIVVAGFLLYRWNKGHPHRRKSSRILWTPYSHISRLIKGGKRNDIPLDNSFDESSTLEGQPRLGEVQPFSLEEVNRSDDTIAGSRTRKDQ